MERYSIRLQNHDFEANTKVFVIDFDNVNSSKDLIHALVKINMMRVINLNKRMVSEGRSIDKKDFESIIMFLSSYRKAKDMNERLQSLFTIVEERNSEQKYEGMLQHKERLDEFVEHTTELVNLEPYYRYFNTNKDELRELDVDWIRHMLMLWSSRGVMQTGLTIPSKNTACIRLDDLYAITSDYSTSGNRFENYLEPLKRMLIQLAGRMARTNEEGNQTLSENNENYITGDISTRKKVETNRVLILFKATETQSGERIDFFNCLRLLERIPSIRLCDEINYCTFKVKKNSQKDLLESDPSYELDENKGYASRVRKVGKLDLVYEICKHLEIVDSSMTPPSQREIKSYLPSDTEVDVGDLTPYFQSVYENDILPDVFETVEKIQSYGVPREMITINWANNRAIISGLSLKSLWKELDGIQEKSRKKEIGFLQFFEKHYFPEKAKNSRTKKTFMINIAISRNIAKPIVNKISDTFGEQAGIQFIEFVKDCLSSLPPSKD